MITADDCYRVLSIPFLDRKRCGRITASVLSAIHTGQLAAHETTDHDHTWFHDPCLAAPELTSFVAACSVPARLGMQVIRPRHTMLVHRDDHYLSTRISSIVVALLPYDQIPSTHWYAAETDTEPAVTATWRKWEPKLLNIQQWHGGISVQDRHRVTLQISLAASFETVIDFIRARRLFGDYACDLA